MRSSDLFHPRHLFFICSYILHCNWCSARFFQEFHIHASVVRAYIYDDKRMLWIRTEDVYPKGLRPTSRVCDDDAMMKRKAKKKSFPIRRDFSAVYCCRCCCVSCETSNFGGPAINWLLLSAVCCGPYIRCGGVEKSRKGARFFKKPISFFLFVSSSDT